MVRREKICNFSDPERIVVIRREKILNFRGPDTENIDFWRSRELQGEKILNFLEVSEPKILIFGGLERSGERKY